VLERKIRISHADRRRWGVRRQGEALAALRVLGVAPGEVGAVGRAWRAGQGVAPPQSAHPV